MAHDEPATSNAPVIGDQVPHLPMHLPQSRPDHRRIMLGPAEEPGVLFIGKLKVRHVDVNDSVQKPQRRQGIIAARVIHQRQPQALSDRDHQGLKYLRHDMARRDEVDIMTTQTLQLEHHLRQLCGAHLRAQHSGTDVVILAKDARQVAVGKKDRPRSARPHENILFAEVATDAGHRCAAARATKTRFPLQAIAPASMGTDHTAPQALHGFLGPLGELSVFVEFKISGCPVHDPPSLYHGSSWLSLDSPFSSLTWLGAAVT